MNFKLLAVTHVDSATPAGGPTKSSRTFLWLKTFSFIMFAPFSGSEKATCYAGSFVTATEDFLAVAVSVVLCLPIRSYVGESENLRLSGFD